MSSQDNTQLTDAQTYNVSNMRFRKVIEGSVPSMNGAPEVKFKRVPIGTRNPDGSFGDLILQTERLYSFGLSPNINRDNGKTDGYTLTLCLHNRNSPSEEEKRWVDVFNKIVDHTKDHLIQNKDEYGKYDLERSDLRNLNPIWYKKEKGKVVEGSSPILYAKLMQNKKNGTISTIMTNDKDEDLDPMTLINKPCYVVAAIKIEGIFIGAKVALQVKVQEATIYLIDNAPKRLLRRSLNQAPQLEISANVEDEKEEPVHASASSSNDNDNDDGSIKGSDDEESDKEEEKPVTPPPAPTARRPLKKK